MSAKLPPAKVRSAGLRLPALSELFSAGLAVLSPQWAKTRKPGPLPKALRARRVNAMRFESLEPRVLLSADLGVINASAFTAYFAAAQSQLDSAVFSAPIPLIGTQLASTESGRIAQNIADALHNYAVSKPAGVAVTPADVETGLRSALGSLIKNNTIVSTSTAGNGEYQFALTLAGKKSEHIDLNLALDADAVLSARLGLVDEVSLSFDWSVDLVFGVSETLSTPGSQVFFSTSAADELKLTNIVAVLDGGADGLLAAKGTAGVFGALIQKDAGMPAVAATSTTPAIPAVLPLDSKFTGSFRIDFTGGGADKRVVLAEIPGLRVVGLVTGKADINLDIDAALIPDFGDVATSTRIFNLGVQADVTITQNFVDANTQAAQFGDAVKLAYSSVRLDLGKFFNEFFDPTVAALQKALAPIKPIVDFLSFPIPVLSDIGKAVGYGAITPIDLGISATLLDTDLSKAQKDARVSRLTQARQVVGFLDAFLKLKPIGQGLPTTVDLGDFAVSLLEDPEAPADPAKPELTRMNASSNLLADIDKAKAGPAGEKFKDYSAEFNGNLKFPFLNDPSSVLKMLMGDSTPELVNFGGKLAFGFEFGKKFPIPALPILSAQFKFELKAELKLDAGYDLFGAKLLTSKLDFSSEANLKRSVADNAYRLADGFYFDDHFGSQVPATLQDGAGSEKATVTTDFDDPFPAEEGKDSDNPELTLSAKLSAGGSLGGNLVVASFEAGVNVFFDTSVFFDLNDLPNPQNSTTQLDYVHDLLKGNSTAVPDPALGYTYDGRVRIGEINLITRADAAGFFNMSGALTAGLDAFVKATVGVDPFKITLIDKTFSLVKINLYDFNIYQLADGDVLSGKALNPPVIGAVAADGTLNLYLGDTASSRRNTGVGRVGVDSETYEDFSISSQGLTDAAVPGGGETLTVKFFVVENGKRVERVQQVFTNVKRIVASGGSGNDTIVVEASVAAPAVLSGGAGDDVLTYGGSGVADLRGDADSDTLTGGANDDTLDGGAGNDTLIGNAGNDSLRGGDNDDRLMGGLGLDQLIGGAGNDTYAWVPDEGVDTYVEDAGLAGADRITFDGSAASDAIVLSRVLDAGAQKVGLQITVGTSPTVTVLLDNIEQIALNAGGGSDTLTVGDLTGTDLSLLAVDLSASDGTGSDKDGDHVIFTGSSVADTLTVEGATAQFARTDFAANPSGGVSTLVPKPVVKLSDTTPAVGATPARNSSFFIINSSPERDTLEVRGLGGNDTLVLSGGSQGIDVSSLIAVTLDGGADNDLLVSAFDSATLLGGDGVDAVQIQTDGQAVSGTTDLQLFSTDLLVSRNALGGSVQDRLAYSGFESFRLDLDPVGAGSNLRVVGTLPGAVEIRASAATNSIAIEGLAGATRLAFSGGANTVTVGKAGAMAGILAALDVAGGAGADRLVFDASAEVASLSLQIGVTALSPRGLLAAGALRYDAAVDTVELRLGRGADVVDIPSLTRRIVVDTGLGADTVNATLLGAPAGGASSAGLDTRQAEQVSFTNNQNIGSTDWLLSNQQLRAGTPGVFDPLHAGFYDQIVLQTAGANGVNLTLADGPGADRLRIWDLVTETHVALRGGDDTVVIGDDRVGARRALADIDALLVLDGGTGGETLGDTLSVDDRANTVNGVIDPTLPSLTLGPGRIASSNLPAGQSITHTGFSALDVKLGDTLDNVRLLDTAIRTTLNLGGGDDLLFVDKASAGSQAAPGTLIDLGAGSDRATVYGGTGLSLQGGSGSGADTVVFDIGALGTPTTGGVLGESGGQGLLSGLGAIGDAAFSGFDTAQLELGQNSDQFTLDITVPELFVAVHGNGGDDTVTVKRIPASVSATPTTEVTGGAGVDAVVLDIPAAPWASTGAGSSQVFTHGNLITDLGLQAETLRIDNSRYAGGVDWRIVDGKLSATDLAGTLTPIDLVYADIANEVRILAGGNADDRLTITATSNPVQGTIDGNRVELLAGRVVLDRAAAVDNLPSRNAAIDFDSLPASGSVLAYVEDGFKISGNAGLLRDARISPALAAAAGTTFLTVERVNGNAFAIQSLDLAAATAGTKTVTLTGTTVNGGTVTQTLSYAGAQGFSTQNVNLAGLPGFAALRSLKIDLGAGAQALVDNLVLRETLAFDGATAATVSNVARTIFPVDNPNTPLDESIFDLYLQTTSQSGGYILVDTGRDGVFDQTFRSGSNFLASPCTHRKPTRSPSSLSKVTS